MSAVSGIAVAAHPDRAAEVRNAIDALPWASVYYSEPDGRMVATIEADTTDACMDRLSELKRIPHVLTAEMVEHVCEDETWPAPDPTSARPIARLERPLEELAATSGRRARKSREDRVNE